MIEGHFIVIEGIDGAGTTTQCELLGTALRKKGLPVTTTREPSDGPVGMLIRQILRGRVVVPGVSGSRAPSWASMALLFAADRADHLDAEIIPNLMDGVTVVSDRYDHSSVAYQSLDTTRSDTIGWIRTLNKHARRPDLTIVLDVSADIAARRRRDRGTRPDLFEDTDTQKRLASFYTELEQHFRDELIVHVDGNRDAASVHADVLKHVHDLRARG